MRKTKIVITLGPATGSPQMIESLMGKGVNVFRLNFSHGDHTIHADTIRKIRAASQKLGKEVAIMQDISGPKVRIGKIKGALELKKGDRIVLVKEKKEDDPKVLDISFPDIIDMVNIGDEVYFADGTIRSLVVGKEPGRLELQILVGGSLTSHKGVNFPHTRLTIPAITPKDEDDLRFGAAHDVDIVALSFVQTAEDIRLAKKILVSVNADPFIVAKIETGHAIENLDAILKESDGVMVARGDLGAEFGVTKVPRIQKHILKTANEMNRPSITATQMLTSMKENPFPTRAEVSDIANAVYDGTDAVMLSDETAIGNYPLQAVEVLHDAIKDAEKEYPWYRNFTPHDKYDAVAKAAVQLSQDLKKEALVAFTTSGYSVQVLSRYRPKENIYAVSHSLKTHRKMSLLWGVHPLFIMPSLNNPTRLLYEFVKKLLDEKRITIEKRYIVTMGDYTGRNGSNNLIRLLDKEGMESVLGYEF